LRQTKLTSSLQRASQECHGDTRGPPKASPQRQRLSEGALIAKKGQQVRIVEEGLNIIRETQTLQGIRRLREWIVWAGKIRAQVRSSYQGRP
jgi:hypothetical protein